MRSKEVEEAINQLIVDINFSEAGCSTGIIDVKNIETVLDYIQKLEELPNKIRDEIKELEELWQEFNEDYYSDGCDRCEYQIELLKELIDDKSKNVWVD